MSPEAEDFVRNETQDEVNDIDPETEKAAKAAAKRRTKSGCLTCRKRRIKCGEERPTCKNCIKSKRECAGYNPPLVYKHGQEGPLSIPIYNTHHADGYAHCPIEHQGYGPRQRIGLPYAYSTSQAHLITENPTLPHSQSHLYHSAYHGGHVGPASAQGQWPSAPTILDSRRETTILQEQSDSNITITPHATSLTSGPYLGGATSHTSIYPGVHRIPGSQAPTYNEHGFIEKSSLTWSDPVHTRHPCELDGNEDNSDDPYDVLHEIQDCVPESCAYGHIQEVPDQRVFSSAQIAFQNSPLINSRSQRIFQHFIVVTGPNMSIFDRLEHVGPHNPPKMVWTNGLPAMAFNHPALAHGILAISAMQLARLGQGSQETALKHFTLALRRAGKLLASDESRHHVSTLATILLLAYYEVIVGDHSRWSLHLSGAAKLVMEHNYAAIFRNVRRMRTRAKAELQQPWRQSSFDHDNISTAGIPDALLDDSDWQVDHTLVSRLMGIKVDYDSQMQSNLQMEPTMRDFNKAELDDLRILMEMYWWYIKQDVFQSMLSGDAPMLPYSKMKYCPPRGPIGRVERPHATMDHLWLIMARLVTFGAQDKTRKLKVVASQGGEWIPAPGFLIMPSMSTNVSKPGSSIQTLGEPPQPLPNLHDPRHETPPIANEGRTRKVKHPPFTVPGAAQAPMYGMIPPPTGPVHMSTSFNAMNAELQKDTDNTPESNHPADTSDLGSDLNKALAEHASITSALDLFRSCLGEDFDPLSGGEQLTTPFGPPLRYQSPTIATMWTFYHVCRILLRRLHPHSPPAAMVSAGVNAFPTRVHAQTIGKIIGGLYAQHSILVSAGHVDYMFTAALMETTFPLLFAAVQYQDPAQRGWTIAKLGDIAQHTGWASSSAVAAACETTWERMGMVGKGPPYTRTLDRRNADARVSGRAHGHHTTPKVPPPMDAVAEHESRFVSHDRELIVRHGSTRAYWALGLLSVEEDLEKMELGKKNEDKKMG